GRCLRHTGAGGVLQRGRLSGSSCRHQQRPGRNCLSARSGCGPFAGHARSPRRPVLRQRRCGDHRQAAVQSVQLLGMSFQRRRRNGAEPDGQRVDLRRPAGTDPSDARRRTAERDARLGRQDPRSAALADRRLRALAVPAADAGCTDRRYPVTDTRSGAQGSGRRPGLDATSGHHQRLRGDPPGALVESGAAVLLRSVMTAASLLAGVLAAAAALLPRPLAAAPRQPILTVCADPNNMPFSNRAGEGFENRIAQLIAANLHMQVRYVWWAQRRGYLRNTLRDARCDLWPGIAAGSENVLTTRPYYRSTYVFVTRRRAGLSGLTLDDPRLRSLSIGVQMVGNYATPNPPARIVNAVARGEVDVAMVWGPLAGYFAGRSRIPLRLEPVTPAVDAGVWPMTYDIAVGVRRNEPQLRERIEQILVNRKP